MDKAMTELTKLQKNRPEEEPPTPGPRVEENKANSPSQPEDLATDGARMNTDKTEAEMETEQSQSSSSVSICAPSVAKMNEQNGENKANPALDAETAYAPVLRK